MAGLLLELEDPLVEDRVCDLLVLSFALEALCNHTGVEINPLRYTFIQFILLVYLPTSLYDQLPDPLLGRLQNVFLAFHSVEQLDNIFRQRFKLFLRIYLFADTRT